MAHFAFVSPLFAGHIDPMAALAAELRARGHRTTLVGIPDGAPIAAARGFDFVPVGADTHPPGRFGEMAARCGRVAGLRGYGALRQDAIDLLTMYCRELPAALRDLDVDLIVCDQSEAAGSLVAYRIGRPFVSVAAALPFNWEPGVPPPAFGWSFGTSPWHRWRNIAAAYAINRWMRPFMAVAEGIARDWRLPLGRDVHHYMSGLAQIGQLVPSLDMPRVALSGCFHYCGPLRPPRAPAVPPRDPTRVFASLGSLQGHRADLFAAIARATAAEGLDLVLAHGGRLGPEECRALSRVADVRDLVDQPDMMARVGLAILHGGLNTVLDALAAGVPIVVAPIGFEQKAIAARVERAGAGRVCSLRALRAGGLQPLVAEVRHDPAYAAAAGRLRDEIAAHGGAARAAAIIEDVLRTGQPVLSPDGLRRRERRTADLADRGAREVRPRTSERPA